MRAIRARRRRQASRCRRWSWSLTRRCPPRTPPATRDGPARRRGVWPVVHGVHMACVWRTCSVRVAYVWRTCSVRVAYV
eukprot:scaffold86084_cov58-Phaeocystis_antarctica.AAC.1